MTDVQKKFTVVAVDDDKTFQLVDPRNRIDLKVFRSSVEANAYLMRQVKEGNDDYLLLMDHYIDQSTGMDLIERMVTACINRGGLFPKYFSSVSSDPEKRLLAERFLFHYINEDADIVQYINLSDTESLCLLRSYFGSMFTLQVVFNDQMVELSTNPIMVL